jgi:hydrogenase maturation protease
MTARSASARSAPTLTGALDRPRHELSGAVEVLVCGSADRGDDGAPLVACELVRSRLPAEVSLRKVGQLDVDDLLSIEPGAGVVIVDAATGIDAGAVIELPLSGLIGSAPVVHPRSSHALAIPEIVGLADMIRGRPLRGRIVAVGATKFGLGQPISRAVVAALPSLADAILDAIEHVGWSVAPGPRGS